MTDEEKQYQEDLKKNGVDVPELKDDDTKDKKPEDVDLKDKKPDDDKDKDLDKDDDLEDKSGKQPEKKRSIYDDYKDTKKELKTERELREQAEKERDDLKTKLESLDDAKTPKEKKEALDDLEAYAEKIGADPEALKELQEIFLKSIKSDDTLKEKLEKFEKWQKDNALVIAEGEFNKEFEKTLPTIKQMFPTASDTEIADMKKELNKVAHSKGWEDKELDYILFKHKDTLEKLVSPKKKGLENKDMKEEGDISDDDFDPNADLSKMTPLQRDKWEKKYRSFGKSEGLMKDSEGRLSIL